MIFPFCDAPNAASIICCHIIESDHPILYVSHDEDDGMWQFLCGAAHETEEARVVSLKEVYDLDNTVGFLKICHVDIMRKERRKMMLGS